MRADDLDAGDFAQLDERRAPADGGDRLYVSVLAVVENLPFRHAERGRKTATDEFSRRRFVSGHQSQSLADGDQRSDSLHAAGGQYAASHAADLPRLRAD